MVFDRITLGRNTDFNALDKKVREVVESLQDETRRLRATLCIYLIAAWAMPAIGVVMVLCY